MSTWSHAPPEPVVVRALTALERSALATSAGAVAASEGRFEEAIAHFTRATAFAPGAMEPRIGAAETWLLAGRPDRAREEAWEALQVLSTQPDPDDSFFAWQLEDVICLATTPP